LGTLSGHHCADSGASPSPAIAHVDQRRRYRCRTAALSATAPPPPQLNGTSRCFSEPSQPATIASARAHLLIMRPTTITTRASRQRTGGRQRQATPSPTSNGCPGCHRLAGKRQMKRVGPTCPPIKRAPRSPYSVPGSFGGQGQTPGPRDRTLFSIFASFVFPFSFAEFSSRDAAQ
jgi:hypothetical protein